MAGYRARPAHIAWRVGLPDSVSLFALNDLDNYLFPLIPRLSERTGRQFAAVQATKRHGAASYVTVATARISDVPPATFVAKVVTTASASTTAYKEQVRDQLVCPEPLPGMGVRLDLAFRVGPQRAWPNLWKATIDSLGRLLGRDVGAGEWNARDGRIVDLRLHCTVDGAIGNQVNIEVRASPVMISREDTMPGTTEA